MRKRVINLCLFFVACIGAAAIAFWAFKKYGIGIPCVYNKIFHIKCPGCGMTRASICFLSGDFIGVFKQNALFYLIWFEIISVAFKSGILYLKTGHVQIKSINKYFDICVLIMIIVYGILRNIL